MVGTLYNNSEQALYERVQYIKEIVERTEEGVSRIPTTRTKLGMKTKKVDCYISGEARSSSHTMDTYLSSLNYAPLLMGNFRSPLEPTNSHLKAFARTF